MVTKLVGKLDNQDIIFELLDSGEWVYIAPPPASGTYIVSLTAYDDAGNEAYITKYLLTFDPVNLRMSLVPFDFSSQLQSDIYARNMTVSDYVARLATSDIYVSCRLSAYFAQLIDMTG